VHATGVSSYNTPSPGAHANLDDSASLAEAPQATAAKNSAHVILFLIFFSFFPDSSFKLFLI
jgi:hypothetical protein